MDAISGKPRLLNRFALAIDTSTSPARVSHFVEAGVLKPDFYLNSGTPLFLASRRAEIAAILKPTSVSTEPEVTA